MLINGAVLTPGGSDISLYAVDVSAASGAIVVGATTTVPLTTPTGVLAVGTGADSTTASVSAATTAGTTMTAEASSTAASSDPSNTSSASAARLSVQTHLASLVYLPSILMALWIR